MADVKKEFEKLTLDELKDVPKKPPKPEPPFADITKAMAMKVLEKLRTVEESGGYTQIARDEKIPVSWVKQVEKIRGVVIKKKEPGAESVAVAVER